MSDLNQNYSPPHLTQDISSLRGGDEQEANTSTRPSTLTLVPDIDPAFKWLQNNDFTQYLDLGQFHDEPKHRNNLHPEDQDAPHEAEHLGLVSTHVQPYTESQNESPNTIDPNLENMNLPNLDWLQDPETVRMLEEFERLDQQSRAALEFGDTSLRVEVPPQQYICPTWIDNLSNSTANPSRGEGAYCENLESTEALAAATGVPQSAVLGQASEIVSNYANATQISYSQLPVQFQTQHTEPHSNAGPDIEMYDSDATVEEYHTPYHSESSSGVRSMGEFLTNAPIPRVGDPLGDYVRSIQSQKPTQTQGTGQLGSTPQTDALRSVDPNSAVGTMPKRGRGRPIVPGSKRQRRIQAMAQPDYVPPKRGRPRTSERHLRKRIRRAANIKLPTTSRLAVSNLNKQSEQTVQLPTTAASTVEIIDDDTMYTPNKFILSESQARKIAQIFRVSEPRQGWADQAVRNQVTFNLRRLTPSVEIIMGHIRQILLDEQDKSTPSNGNISQEKENQIPDGPDSGQHGDTSPGTQTLQATPKQISSDLAARIPYIPCTKEPSQFPDGRLKLRIPEPDGQFSLQAMQVDDIIAKLMNDERDVYFRAVIWEILKGSPDLYMMEFVGTMNTMRQVWELE
ncbi:hypothetical protein ABW19_dt0210089 [Dactylella cylindrospora]|nr:hypothetical protein ABW19_dt0210089 [Dactylella cylindrospora]